VPVPTRITDISTTAASNSPSGSESVGTSLDDYLRAVQTVYRLDLASKGADIASASTTDLGAVGGSYHDITGTTTITSFGTVAAGIAKVIKFEGALTLTHNATSLILPGGANITTADGDAATVISEGSGNWRCVSYFKANGHPPIGYPSAQGSSLVLLSTQTASASATLDFESVISSTYDSYELELVNIAPATDNTSLLLRASTDNGSTYLSTNEYDYGIAFQSAASVSTLSTDGGQDGTNFNLANGVGNASNRNVGGTVKFSISSSGACRFTWHTQYTSNAGNEVQLWGGGSAGTGIDAIRLLYSSGNIASGVARLYGKKSS
jgi:hypothetical protein